MLASACIPRDGSVLDHDWSAVSQAGTGPLIEALQVLAARQRPDTDDIQLMAVRMLKRHKDMGISSLLFNAMARAPFQTCQI